ncbi:uncharacterized protein LOC126318685 [Schistocerca gregaria]|uniref:uncharacterized protein LOC126318685 n=1 Tax=Schistocerca gregaria TaxID=7010 RepID=UPI00211EBE40|nr:uncharacterized protein LOC126318685 [Schistocerca gregaria]
MCSPLMYVCANSCVDVALELVQRGAKADAPNSDNIYPLHIACENDRIDLARVLVEVGKGNTNVADNDGTTPLHLAASNDSISLCRLLIEYGANIYARTKQNRLPYEFTHNKELKNILKGMCTSLTHPLQIDFIESPLLGDSCIGMTMCPGRNKRQHRRSLEADIEVLVQNKVDVLVSLIQISELEAMGIPDMIQRVRNAGIEVLHVPIPDKWIPSSMRLLANLINRILEYIHASKRVVVHCNGGKGRTGFVVVATLVTLGMEPREATQLVRSVRKGMLYNPAQILYIRAYKLNLRSMNPDRIFKYPMPIPIELGEKEGIRDMDPEKDAEDEKKQA